MTPREMWHASNRMIDLIVEFHKDGLVCDVIDTGYLIIGLDEKVSDSSSFVLVTFSSAYIFQRLCGSQTKWTLHISVLFSPNSVDL